MTYWVAVCEADANPGVTTSGPGMGSIYCRNADGTINTAALQPLEVQLMVVPPAGSGFDGLWQLGSISVSDALVISTAIAAVWALAWTYRQISASLSSKDSSSEE